MDVHVSLTEKMCNIQHASMLCAAPATNTRPQNIAVPPVVSPAIRTANTNRLLRLLKKEGRIIK